VLQRYEKWIECTSNSQFFFAIHFEEVSESRKVARC
jgi:hypothetical protein